MKIPAQCPSCEQKLFVSHLKCETCDTEIIGTYKMPLYMLLTTDEQEFVKEFLLSSGSLKDMASKIGKSYPTVRNKLDDIISKINDLDNNNL